MAKVAFTDATGGTWYQERGSINLPSSWSGAATNTNLMNTGSRTVSMSSLRGGSGQLELLVTQAQPQ
jgi:hypothetical protein